jgi:hypothetical protein
MFATYTMFGVDQTRGQIFPARTDDTPPATIESKRDGDDGPFRGLGWLAAVGVPAVGLIGLVLFALTLGSARATLGALGTGCMAAVAASGVGALLGFLFGIPRSAQETDPAGGQVRIRDNTNLEQVSDWLTKILVGVGLVQIGNAGGPARRLVGALGAGMGDTASARAVAAGLLVAFVVWGFLVSYLLTRTIVRDVLQQRLDEVARQAASLASGQMERRLDDLAIADANALALVDRALNPSTGTPPPPRSALTEALSAARPDVLTQVFLRARQQRESSWRSDKARMALTIPVFGALIDLDTDRRFHRLPAQLAFALKDRENATTQDWERAESLLSEAITIRGSSARGFLMYEFNRALCRIRLDPAGPAQPSSAALRAAVLADLRSAATSEQMYRIIDQDEQNMIKPWLQKNGLGMADLSGP